MKLNADTNRPLVKKILTRNGYYLYDARSNRILRVTSEMYDLLDNLDPSAENETVAGANFAEKDENDSISRLKSLFEQGMFQSGPVEQRLKYPISQPEVERELSNGPEMITLEMTDACNMRCDYCSFSGGYEYERKHGNRKLSIDTAKATIDFYINARKNSENLNVGFYGGEPLLNFEVIQEVCEYLKSKVKAQSNDKKIISFSITTNGTLLDDRKLSWLMDNDFAITVSFDGPSQIHNTHRSFPSGKGTFDVVLERLQRIHRLDAKYYNKRVLVNVVLCPCADLMDVKRFFESTPHLFGNKLHLSAILDGNPTYFSKHLPYADRERDMETLHQEYISFLVEGKGLTKKFWNSFVRQVFESDYLRLRKRIILDGCTSKINQLNSCFPGQRKIFVDLDGTLHVCEKMTRFFPIGDVWNGYDMKRVEKLFNDFAAMMNSSICRNCWGVRLCSHCFTDGKDGRFDDSFQNAVCPINLEWHEKIITSSCEILERNPSAFEYMKDMVIG